MTVQITLGLPNNLYRTLSARAEEQGIQVKEILTAELAHAAGEVSDFEIWCASLDPAAVAKERVYVPRWELAARLFSAETQKLSAYLRHQARMAPTGYLDFRAERAGGRETHG